MFKLLTSVVIAACFSLVSTAHLVASPKFAGIQGEILLNQSTCETEMSGNLASVITELPCALPVSLDATTHSGGHVDIGTVADNSHVHFDGQTAEKSFALAIVFAGLLPEPPLQPPQIS